MDNGFPKTKALM